MIVICIVGICASLLPLLAHAFAIVAPSDDTSLIKVPDPFMPAEFDGTLSGYPHTYAFDVSVENSISIALRIPKTAVAHDAEMILVREEDRGVSEVGRTLSSKAAFSPISEPVISAAFLDAGSITATLPPGSYHLEVSSPANDASYQLIFNSVPKRSYFENLSYLFDMNAFLKRSPIFLLLSPIVYIPLLILAFCGLVSFLIIRKRKHV